MEGNINKDLVDTCEKNIALWREKLRQVTHESPDTDTAANGILEVHVTLSNHIEALGKVIEEARLNIQEIMAETGNLRIESPYATAMITSPSESVSYDNRRIEAVCISDPEMKKRLLPFRRVSRREGGLLVRRK